MARPRRLRRRHPASGPVALSGRVALVTGAARGIGRAIALALAREGADVACADLLPAEDTAQGVRALGRRALALRVDIGRAAHARRMIADTARRLGGLDILAYNLGNLPRRLVLPPAIQSWSLTSLQQRLFKTGGRLIRHARYFILQLAESYLTPTLFRQILGRIERLAWHPT